MKTGKVFNPEVELEYRKTMQVREVRVRHDTVYGEVGDAVCPKCGYAVEREYTSFCGHCGQKLGWRRFSRAKIIRISVDK